VWSPDGGYLPEDPFNIKPGQDSFLSPREPPLRGCLHGFALPEGAPHQLTLMKEPSLCGKREGESVIRFIWLRSFDPVIVVRIIARAGRWQLTAMRLPFRRRPSPGDGGVYDDVDWRLSRSLTRHEWSQVLSKVGAVSAESQEAGLDGAEWILESNVEGTYRIANKWAPDEKHPMYIAGMAILRLLAPVDGGVPAFDETRIY
jgi:hypothetical protein